MPAVPTVVVCWLRCAYVLSLVMLLDAPRGSCLSDLRHGGYSIRVISTCVLCLSRGPPQLP